MDENKVNAVNEVSEAIEEDKAIEEDDVIAENMTIAVSVIVPAYNAQDTLEECLQSLAYQTLENIEVIVVDDGSIDDTYKIIQKYEAEFPNRIVGVRKENGGVSSARNCGLDLARGEYVGFVDADDSVDFEMFEKLYQRAIETESDMVQCWRYDVIGSEKTVQKPKKRCTGQSIYQNPEIISAQTMFVWDKIFKNNIIQENGVRFKYRYHEDFLFAFEFELHAQGIELLCEPLYFYKAQREGAATTAGSGSALDAPEVFTYINDLALRNGSFPQFERYLWRVESWAYVRRVNSFFQYYDIEQQEALSKKFFDLFEKYFYGWRTTIRWTGTKKKLQYYFNAYRSDWDKMQKFIRCPIWLKRAFRKPVFLVVSALVAKDKIRKKIQRKKENYRARKPSMAYAKYLKYPIDENAVLLTSYFGSSFSDSIYYMAKDLLENTSLKVYVGTNKPHRETTFIKFNNLSPTLVDVNSDQYREVLATAKYLVCNSRFPTYFFKREGQVCLNTWHGTPLKTLGKDMNTGLKDVGNNQTQFMMCDYLLYPNEYTCTHIMNSFFLNELYAGKVLMCGYPRNSAFFEDEDRERIRSELGFSGKKVYMYMPTWRGETLNTVAIRKYRAELVEILDQIDSQLSDDIIIFIKLHQVVMRKIKLPYYKHIRQVHPLYENYRFLNLMDGLITDYSSVFFDYANSKREILLFTYDYDEYMNERGMYFDMEQLPFPRCDTVEELLERINDTATFAPDENYLRFVQQYCGYDSPNSPEYANEALLMGDEKGNARLLDFSHNKEKAFEICFMSNLKDPIKEAEFEELVSEENPNRLFVFAQWSFARRTNEILAGYANSGIHYVVTPGEMPVTKREIMYLALYRKFHLYKEKARILYQSELKRILPNVNISGMRNYSTDPKFTDIYSIFGKDFSVEEKEVIC